MSPSRTCPAGAAVALVLGLSMPAAGQQASAGARLQTFTFSQQNEPGLEQAQFATVPFLAGWASSAIDVRIRGAYARGIATMPGGGYSEIAGLIDTEISAAFSVGWLTVGAVGLLPTGDALHSMDELPLVGIVASELLPLEVESWGAGGGFGGEARASRRIGSAVVSLAGARLVTNEYRPLEGVAAAYRPGAQTRLAIDVDAHLGIASIASVRLGYQRFDEDVYEDTNLFRPGTRWEGLASFAHPIGARESASVYAGYYVRSRSDLVLPNEFLASRTLPGVVESSARRRLVAGGEMRVSRDRLVVAPAAQLRLLRTDDGVGDAWLGSVGVAVDYRVAGGRFDRRLVVSPEAGVHVGSFRTSGGGDTGVRGWDVGIGIRWQGGE